MPFSSRSEGIEAFEDMSWCELIVEIELNFNIKI